MLKNRETGKELFVVVISLLPTEEAKKQGAEDPDEKFVEVHGSEAKGGDDDELD